jgi:hypothetical protein
MFKSVATAAVCVFASCAALAQNATTNSSTTPPAISTSTSDSKTSAAPVAGANSFTESEAKTRIEARGYTSVSNLAKDPNAIWRGKAMKDGAAVDVALDYQGNVTAK